MARRTATTPTISDPIINKEPADATPKPSHWRDPIQDEFVVLGLYVAATRNRLARPEPRYSTGCFEIDSPPIDDIGRPENTKMKLTEVAPFSLLFGLSLLAVACGGRESNGAAPIALSDVPNQLVAAYCNGFGNCCASKGFAFNATVCNTSLNGRITADNICPATGVYDAQAAGDCLAELQSELSSCSTSGNTASACNRICPGTLSPGATCQSDQDCAPSASGTVLCTPSATSGATSVCVVFSHGKAGDPCQATCTTTATDSGLGVYCHALAIDFDMPVTASCYASDGLICSTNAVCNQLPTVGSRCAAECAADAYCDFNTALCTAKIALGASCATLNSYCSMNGCPASICVDSAYCSVAQICEAKKAGGATCQSSDECNGFCDTNTQQCVDYNSTGLYVSPTSDNCANPTSK